MFAGELIDNSISQQSLMASGGRYDNLVNSFAKSKPVPCVGVSMNFEHIFSVMESKLQEL